MRAMLLGQIGPIDASPLKLTELPMPEPEPGHVRLKVSCCAICRTDLHVIEGDLPRQKLPIVPGHQIVGTVDALAGIYMTPLPAMDYERHIFYERDIHSVTCNTRDDGRELLAEAARIPVRPHTTTYPLAEANRALQDLKNDRINGTGVLVMDRPTTA